MDGVVAAGPAGRILVVDDDPATLRMVTSYLREHSLQAGSAANGREVTQHLASGEPSLIAFLRTLTGLYRGRPVGEPP
jgi:DNA-binding response OmpR family regulator